MLNSSIHESAAHLNHPASCPTVRANLSQKKNNQNYHHAAIINKTLKIWFHLTPLSLRVLDGDMGS